MAAGLVLLLDSRLSHVVSLLVLLGRLAAVLRHGYVDLPAIGPIPSMYEPVSFANKVVSTAAQAVGSLVCLVAPGFRRSAVRPVQPTTGG